MFKMQVEGKPGMEECEVEDVIAVSAGITELGNSKERTDLGKIWGTCQENIQ